MLRVAFSLATGTITSQDERIRAKGNETLSNGEKGIEIIQKEKKRTKVYPGWLAWIGREGETQALIMDLEDLAELGFRLGESRGTIESPAIPASVMHFPPAPGSC